MKPRNFAFVVGAAVLAAFVLAMCLPGCVPNRENIADGVPLGRVVSVEVDRISYGCDIRVYSDVVTERGVFSVKGAVMYLKGEEAVLAKGEGAKKRDYLCMLESDRCYYLRHR